MLNSARTLRAAIALLLALGAVPATPASASERSAPVLPKLTTPLTRTIVAKARPGVGRADVTRESAVRGLSVVREIPHIGWWVLEPLPWIDVQTAMLALSSATVFEKVEYDAVAVPSTVPNDPLFDQDWGLENTGQFGGTPDADIDATAAWDVSTGSTDVVVAVVDAGTDLSHPDLAANAWVNTAEIPGNGVDDDFNGYVDDVNGWDFANRDASYFDMAEGDTHGTHVAGTIGAVGDNGIGVAGVAWRVRIMACKFIGLYSASVSSGAEAMIYATDNGARIINHSWSTTTYSGVLEDAVTYTRQHGVMNVVAAANSARNIEVTPEWPAAIEATNVVTVAATDDTDALASFSNYGPNLVDFAAPGVDITSTIPAYGAAYYVTDTPYEIAYFGFPIESSTTTETRRAMIARSMARLAPDTGAAVLLVDDSRPVTRGETPGVRSSAYLDALGAAGYTNVTTWDTEAQGTPSASQIAGKAVVWFTGLATQVPGPGNSLDSAERTLIASYLDGGGRLLVSSGGIAGDLDYIELASPWFRQYFHLRCPDFQTWTLGVEGLSGGTMDGMTATVPADEAFGAGWNGGSDCLMAYDGAAEPMMDWVGYGVASGTSMATPHVTGAFALIAAAHPNESLADIRQRIESTLDIVPGLAPYVRTSGRLNVGAAIASYAAPPRIDSPQPRDALLRTSSASVVFTPRSGTATGTEFRAQFGTPNERASNVGWETGALAPWTTSAVPFTVTSAPGDVWSGKYALKSGVIGNSGSTYIQSSVTVPTGGAYLTWRYWLDAEEGYDYAYLTVGGVVKWRAYRTTGWENARLWLPAGTYTLRWTYLKDSSVSVGRDAFGIDEVSVAQYAWSDIGTATAEAGAVTFTVPDLATRSAAVRMRGEYAGRASAWETAENIVLTTDATPPSAPGALSAVPGTDGQVALSWTNPVDSDFTSTRIVRSLTATPASAADGAIVYQGNGTSVTDTGLVNGVRAYYAAFARDTVGNWSAPSANSVVVVDTTAPPSAGLLLAERADPNVDLSWMKPVSADCAGVRVMRRAGEAPSGPTDPLAFTVYEGDAISATDLGILAEETQTVLYYAAYAYDRSGNFAPAATTSLAIDTVVPSGTFAIDGGATYATSSAVTLDSDVADATEMRFDLGAGYGEWQPYAASVDGVLVGGDGERSVTAQYRGTSGFVFETADTILLDTTAPSAPSALAATAVGRDWVDLAWTLPADPPADLAGYRLWRATSASGPWAQLGDVLAPDTATYRDTGLSPDSTYHYRLTAHDTAGNASAPSAAVAVTPGITLARSDGADRYATAIAASQASFDAADDVVLATGAAYADALGAAGLAGALHAPVLLTRTTALPAGLLAEIERLGATRVTIVGGTAAVSTQVEAALGAAGLYTRRIAGDDRYQTAAAVALETLALRDSSPLPGTVFVVRGDGFADALSVSSAAYAGRVPILLVKGTGLPAATVAAVEDGGFDAALVVGGTSAVPDAIAGALGVPYTRVSGADRYATSAAFAQWAGDAALTGFAQVGLATGEAFPDALGGGSAIGAAGGTLLLTDPDTLPASTSALLTSHAEEIEQVRVLGGEAAVTPQLVEQVRALLR